MAVLVARIARLDCPSRWSELLPALSEVGRRVGGADNAISHAHTHTCMHAHTHTHMHAHTHARTHTHACTHTHIHACTHTHMHAHVHIHTQGVHSPNLLLQKCALWTLKGVVKCLAARRLAPDRKVFSDLFVCIHSAAVEQALAGE